ncbi:MAG: HAD hydrolase family protein [Chloroflexi bacterium]|nr:HAD hydrolase family protein [Chloroflexota bacterium]
MTDFPEHLRPRLANIKLLAMDVDGVLTDAGMYYTEYGDELKKFNTRDGKGIELLRHAGIKTAFITGEKTLLVERRAAKLKVDDVCQGVEDKVAALSGILEKYGWRFDQAAYIGDDIADVPLLCVVGLAITVADGLPENQKVAHYITRARGGEGAVREVAMLILEATQGTT